MKNKLTTLLLFLTLTSFATNPTSIVRQLDWDVTPYPVQAVDGTVKYEVWRFDGAIYSPEHPSLPLYYQRFSVEGNAKLNVQLIDAVWEPIQLEGAAGVDAFLNATIDFNAYITKDRGTAFGNVMFIPIRRIPGGYEKLVSFELEINQQAIQDNTYNKGGGFVTSSKLKDGTIYKVAVTTTGLHKMDYDFLVNELGIPSSTDPRKIQVLGNGGGMVPEANITDRPDDLVENPVVFSGETDGQLNNGDFILFYAEGPHQWVYDSDDKLFDFEMNVYDSQNYYFIKVGSENGLRVPSKSSINGSYTSTAFNDFRRKEDELTNLLADNPSSQGSGRQWFGDEFKIVRSYTYNDIFNFPNIRTSEEANIKSVLLSRTSATGTTANVKVAGQTFYTTSFTATDLSDQDDAFATERSINQNFFPNGSNLTVTVEYPQTASESRGWVDFVQINARRNLSMSGDQMSFRDVNTLDHATSNFSLSNASGAIRVWDITDPLSPMSQEFTQNGSTVTFGTSTDVLREFIAYRPDGAFSTPTKVGEVNNQNLHSLSDVNFVIIYPAVLLSEAQRLADHRAATSDLKIELVEVNQIYNEFSSGRKDAAGIRDFARMLYTRDEGFRYLLIFGDGSYDHRNINGGNNNLVQTFETAESKEPIYAFPTDDFFVLLDEDEGGNMNGDLDIALGRIPVRDIEQAKTVVDKIIRYESDPSTLGDWRNRMVFAGDDEDGGTHTRDADGIADEVNENSPQLNLDKIYVDAFNQVSTPGGQRVPSATESLNQNMFKGVLAITYLGHGGPKGWAQERILQIPDINSWSNSNRLPIFITATCTFAGYDDPNFTSAGERTLLNNNGGAIALFTTVRPVLSTSNAVLTSRVTDTLFDKAAGEAQRLGEVLRIAKNNTSTTGTAVLNARKFTLLGDPTMQIALPKYNVVTTDINGIDITQAVPDTIRALEKITITGEIHDENDQLMTDFDGILYPTVFDKMIGLNTLGQDGTPVREYNLQKSVLFKGRASVTAGKFAFTFVVPKDINYEYGYGKISYYAENGDVDASGQYSGLTIGGTNPEGFADDQGPKVEVFMDSEDFVFGGITSENPLLLVKLEDDNGINVVGNSIGHDLTGVLDENTQQTYLLNDFYEAGLDDYTKGEVRYPLSALAEGRHAIAVKAFDVANNSEEAYTEFIVANSGKVALEHVLNYPNPFVNSTCFQFEHNMSGQQLDIMVQIYTVSGRVVKTIQQRISPTDNRLSLDDCIQWDGKDDFGDDLARGVYVYKIKVRAADTGDILLEGESDFEKLVILK